MGALGLLLAAIGAILYWAVPGDALGADMDMIGLILMILGGVGLVAGIFTGTFTSVRRDERVVEVEDQAHHH